MESSERRHDLNTDHYDYIIFGSNLTENILAA